MTEPILLFTTPPEAVQAARLAMARLERALHEATDALELNPDLTGIGLAFLSLEAIHPAYAPLPEVEASTDLPTDLDAARRDLEQVMADTRNVEDKLRYAYTLRDLARLDLAVAGGSSG